jgi:3-oxoacyl-[acyl-carrier protein] reductase
MTKAAVADLNGRARDLAPGGITVNNVQRGPIATDMNPETGEFADLAEEVIALGHYGQPRDVAAVVSYLASRESGYVTGPTGTWTAGSPCSGSHRQWRKPAGSHTSG